MECDITGIDPHQSPIGFKAFMFGAIAKRARKHGSIKIQDITKRTVEGVLYDHHR